MLIIPLSTNWLHFLQAILLTSLLSTQMTVGCQTNSALPYQNPLLIFPSHFEGISVGHRKGIRFPSDFNAPRRWPAVRTRKY